MDVPWGKWSSVKFGLSSCSSCIQNVSNLIKSADIYYINYDINKKNVQLVWKPSIGELFVNKSTNTVGNDSLWVTTNTHSTILHYNTWHPVQKQGFSVWNLESSQWGQTHLQWYSHWCRQYHLVIGHHWNRAWHQPCGPAIFGQADPGPD